PGMEDGHQPLAMRVTVFVEPGVPGVDQRQQLPRPLAGHRLVLGPLEQPLDREPRNRRLRDAGRRDRPPRLPDFRTGAIALVLLADDDVRPPAAGPVVRVRPLRPGPGPALVVMAQAERRPAASPAPLERIEAPAGDGVAAAIV